jgi:hypothetical protein
MKKIFFTACSLFIFINVPAQSVWVHLDGHIVILQKVDTLFFTEYRGRHPDLRTLFNNMPAPISSFMQIDTAFFGFTTKTRAAAEEVNAKLSGYEYQFTTAYYAYKDGTLQAPTSELLLKPAGSSSMNETFKKFGVVVPSGLPGFYCLQVNTSVYNDGDKILALCNRLFKHRLVSVAEPNFIRLIRLNDVSSSDPGSADQDEGNSYTLFPNPSATTVTVAWKDDKEEHAAADHGIRHIRIYNASGKLCGEYLAGNALQVRIDVSQLAVGIYFLSVSDGTHKATKKLVVSR